MRKRMAWAAGIMAFLGATQAGAFTADWRAHRAELKAVVVDGVPRVCPQRIRREARRTFLARQVQLALPGAAAVRLYVQRVHRGRYRLCGLDPQSPFVPLAVSGGCLHWVALSFDSFGSVIGLDREFVFQARIDNLDECGDWQRFTNATATIHHTDGTTSQTPNALSTPNTILPDDFNQVLFSFPAKPTDTGPIPVVVVEDGADLMNDGQLVPPDAIGIPFGARWNAVVDVGTL